MGESIRLKAWQFHSAGMTPTEIDAQMNLREGHAREIIVGIWKEDRHSNGRFVEKLLSGKAL